MTFLRLLKFNIEKGHHHFLQALILESDSITLKFFKIAILLNAVEQPLLKVSYHIIFLLTNLTGLSVQFHSNRNVFPFWFLGPNFPGMRGLIFVLMSDFNDFLSGYLVVTSRYPVVTTS